MPRAERAEHIGLKDLGFDEELKILKETEKAWLVKTIAGEEVWLPRSAFDDDGCLFAWGLRMLQEKIEG